MNEPSLPEETIFAQAVEIDSEAERAAFLDRTCGGNRVLRASVEALLRAHERCGDLLDLPEKPVDTVAEPSVTERAGSMIGPYKLLEQIGEGGMGLVFVAEQQEPIRRKVALKVIKPGMDTRQVVARFEAERQALALMDHPNIARVLDGGATAGGRPFFVMELVKGVPITEYCDQNQVPIRERLELFLGVCQAVQHAHQKGIIHRDIKPSNVLVMSHDGTPVVKMIDFGVAKAIGQQLTDKTLYTGFAGMVGTPLYMSPEQAGLSGLDVDTRSDIYSLGVLLYELLTGTTPFDNERLRNVGYDEMRRIIREEEPPRPSTRLSTLAQAATTVSTNRKSDPRRLTQLIRGELDWMVMKCLEKDRTRRYETAGAFAADVQRYLHDEPVQACPPSGWYRFRKFARRHRHGLATAVGIGAATLLAIGGLAGSIGWAGRDRVAQREAREREADLSLSEAAQLLEQGNSAGAAAFAERAEVVLTGADASGALQQRLAEIRADLEMAERLEQIRLGQSDVEQERYATLEADPKYAQAFRDFGIDVEALAIEQAAERIRTRSIRRELVAALDDWADLRRKDTPGHASWRHLSAVAAAADPDEQRNRLRTAWEHNDGQALEELAASMDVADQPVVTLALLGRTLRQCGRVEPSVTLLRRAYQRHPNDFWINQDLAHSLMALGPARWQEAHAHCVAALTLRPTSPGIRVNLAITLLYKRDLQAALDVLDDAIRLKPDYAGAWLTRGHVHLRLQHAKESLADCTKAAELTPTSAKAWVGRGNANHVLRRWNDAFADYNRAIELNPKHAYAWYNRGNTYHGLGQWESALTDYTKALELNPELVEAWNNRGNVYRNLEQWDKAFADFSEAIRRSPGFVRPWMNRGWTHHGLRHWDQALADFSKAVAIQPTLVEAWQKRGLTYFSMRRWELALADFSKAIELSPENAELRRDRADTYRNLRKNELALADYTKAIDLDPKLLLAWQWRGHTYFNSRQWDKAIADFSQAIELNQTLAELWYYRGAAYRNLQNWNKALTDLAKAVELQPEHAQAWFDRGCTHADLHQWDDAVAALERAVACRPSDAWFWRCHAVALVGARKMDGYRRVGAAMQARFVNVTEPTVAMQLILLRTLEDEDGSSVPLVAWGRCAAKSPECARFLGHALYRAGQYAAAVEHLKETARKGRLWGDDQLFLAMAEQRLGNTEEARAVLGNAMAWIDESDRGVARGTYWFWADEIRIRRLCKEAQALIEGK
jgi:tetratricopeptide (TPR) repeat protein/serine/threonine protein kinase